MHCEESIEIVTFIFGLSYYQKHHVQCEFDNFQSWKEFFFGNARNAQIWDKSQFAINSADSGNINHKTWRTFMLLEQFIWEINLISWISINKFWEF